MIKKLFFAILVILVQQDILQSQIICVDCLRQNTRVSTNVNDKVVNGSFEVSNCIPWSLQGVFCPSSTNYSCDVANWTCTGGGTNSYPCLMVNTVCVVPDGARTAYLGNGISVSVCATVQADTSCLASASCTVPAPPSGFPTTLASYGGTTGVSIEQTISGLTVGSNYVLEFWAGGEDNGNQIYRGLFAVDIGFGKTFLKCVPTNSSGVGHRYVIQFKASNTSHTIKFTNWGHITPAATEVVLDDVRLYAQAELGPAVVKCGVVTALKDQILPKATYFPNPFNTCTDIRSPLLQESATVYLTSFSGRIIKEYQPTESGKLNICRDELPAGLYFLLIDPKEGKRESHRLLITDL